MKDQKKYLRQQQEAEFAQAHADTSNEQLLQYVRLHAERLGHPPSKQEVIGFSYIKLRLGPWPRILEQAGVKEVSATYQARVLKRQEKRQRKRARRKKHQE